MLFWVIPSYGSNIAVSSRSSFLMLFVGTVSQFTLYGILKGNKPDFHVAMAPDRAKSFYASLVERFQRSYKSDAVKGAFFLHLFRHKTIS